MDAEGLPDSDKNEKANGSSGMKIMHVVGARPNFPKVAPIMAEMAKRPDGLIRYWVMCNL